MIRSSIVVVAALGATLLFSAVPARADDDLVRHLIDQCVGCRFPKDLHGRDLHGLRFIGADLRDVDFSRANLSGARFVGANLDGAKFDDADLRNAHFEGVHFRHTSFARAKLDGIHLVGVEISSESVVGVDPRTLHVEGGRRRVWIADRDWWDRGSPTPDIEAQIDRAMRDLHERLQAMPLAPCRCPEHPSQAP